MSGGILTGRLGRHVRLSDEEKAAIAALESHERNCPRGSVLIRENESARELYIVGSGWLHSSVALGNGTRQIMRFHFPGEIIGLPLLAFAESPETVTAVTDVTISPFAPERLAELFGRHPRIAALVLALAVAERVSLADRLTSIGRTSARARVAYLLCEIFSRMRLVGVPWADPLKIPLTQEDIGDATGLTAVHVNRMLRQLVQDGIIERNGNHVRVLDERRLAAEANFTDRSSIETGWLARAE